MCIVPRFRVVNWVSYRKAWKDFFREHPGYRAVHGHMTSTASIYLPVAKRQVCLLIAHARSAGVDPGMKGRITRFLRRNLGKKGGSLPDLFQTGRRGGVWGEDGTGRDWFVRCLMPLMRRLLPIGKRFVIKCGFSFRSRRMLLLSGMWGASGHMKNHTFLLDVFEQVNKKLPSSMLLLVGEGACRI